MRSDVLAALSGACPARIPARETLNHPGLARRAAGLDPWAGTGAAFAETWRKLSIDVHAAAPATAIRPRVPGGTWEEGGWRYADFRTRDRLGIPAEV